MAWYYHSTTGAFNADEKDASPRAIANRPAGTVKIPNRPGEGFVYDGSNWVLNNDITNVDVNIERDFRVNLGKVFVIPGVGSISVSGDNETMRNLQALAFAASLRVAAGDVLTLTPYRDDTNTIFQLTPPQVIELFSYGAAYVSAVYQASWALKDNLPIAIDYHDDRHWP